MVKGCGHTEAKIEFSNKGQKSAMELKKRKRVGRAVGICGPMILLGRYCHWDPTDHTHLSTPK